MSVLLLALAAGMTGCAGDDTPVTSAIEATRFTWRELPPLPRAIAGQMAGNSHGALLVAGGTDFPAPPTEGGAKVWYDTVHVLEPGASSWTSTTPLPHPLAYAAAATTADRVVLAGGSDATQHYADVRSLEWADGSLISTDLPAMPEPLAMAGAAILDGVFYVVGGQGAPDSVTASAAVFALDLGAPESGWYQLPLLPGQGRVLPVVVAQAGRLIVASGAALSRDADGRSIREYLTDAWVWTPDARSETAAARRGVWQRIEDVPRPVVAAPSAPLGDSGIVVFGGDDGELAAQAAQLADGHPGFSRDILAYDTTTGTWMSLGTMPHGLVTTMAVPMDAAIAIIGGEDRPGHRSATVLLGQPGGED